MKNIAIRAENITKDFKIPINKSIKSHILSFGQSKYKKFRTLNNVSFDIEKGDWLGIIGINGSGKTTLLRLIAGIYLPTSGEISKNGKITMVSLGAGFNPDMPARDNIYLNGTLLGLTKKEIDRKYDDIIDFAEVKEFEDMPIINFSSGMAAKLGFAIAIQAEADIYLLDEFSSVGDFAFKKKCELFYKKMKENKKTVIYVTHAMQNIKDYCNKVMWLERGTVRDFGGDNEEIIKRYLKNK